jgi:mono/diheme cytochrome c family protein
VEKVTTSLILAVALFAAMTLTAVAQTPAPAAQPSAATVEEGRKLFVSYGCYQCHGYEAQGSSATGPRLGPRPLPYAGFSRYVRRPAGQMPPYTVKTMADAELEKIYAFVQTRPAPKSIDSIPLLAK